MWHMCVMMWHLCATSCASTTSTRASPTLSSSRRPRMVDLALWMARAVNFANTTSTRASPSGRTGCKIGHLALGRMCLLNFDSPRTLAHASRGETWTSSSRHGGIRTGRVAFSQAAVFAWCSQRHYRGFCGDRNHVSRSFVCSTIYCRQSEVPRESVLFIGTPSVKVSSRFTPHGRGASWCHWKVEQPAPGLGERTGANGRAEEIALYAQSRSGREETVLGKEVRRLASCHVRHEGGSRYEARGDQRRTSPLFVGHFFVNALASAVVTEQIPINTNFPLSWCLLVLV